MSESCICETHGHPIEALHLHDFACPLYAAESMNERNKILRGLLNIRGKRVMSNRTELLEVLSVIAALLEAPANRFGKLEFYTEEASAARRKLLELAQAYEITPSHTILEQAAKVARAAIENENSVALRRALRAKS